MWKDFWVISNYATTNDNTSKFYLRLYTKDSGDLHIRSDTIIDKLDEDENFNDVVINQQLLDELTFWELVITFKDDKLNEVTKKATPESKQWISQMVDIALSITKQEQFLSMGEIIAINSLRKQGILV